MSKVTPRVDLAFKKIFGVEENKDLLISLINAIVPEEDQVADITLLNPYNIQNFARDKLSILDVKAKGESGNLFDIEIQITDEGDYDKRALYYWSKLYAEQLLSGYKYSELHKAIGIHILNFTSIPETTKYHNVFRITEEESGLRYFTDLQLHTIELNKFANQLGDELSEFAEKVKSALDMWVAFLTKHDLLDENKLPKQFEDTNLKKALHALNVINFSEVEQEAYEGRLKWLRMEASAIAKQEANARMEGKIESKMEIAKMMLANGESIDKITKYTGLTKQEIEE